MVIENQEGYWQIKYICWPASKAAGLMLRRKDAPCSAEIFCPVSPGD